MRARHIMSLRATLYVLVSLAVLALVACAARSTTQAPTRPVPTATPPEVATAKPAAPTATSAPPTSVASYAGKPLANFSTDDFQGSGRCAACHASLKDAAGNDVTIDAQWRSTMMANAARDPLFLASVSREIERAPALRAIVEDKCSGCHMPMAHVQTLTTQGTPSMFESGFLSADNALHAAAMDGVSCALCHQIADSNLGKQESFSGGYAIDASTSPPDRLVYGPFPSPERETMRKSGGFTPVEGRQSTDAALCATCHTLYTPYVDAAGKVLGEFPEQTAYLEWQHSTYGGAGKAFPCQGCHMPAAAGPALLSNLRTDPPLAARSPFAQHYFVGGNALMLRLHSAHAAELGLTCSTDHLNASLDRVLAQVQERAASLSIASAQASGSELSVVLELRSMAGHKLPTGFPSRRMWIHLVVTDSGGKIVFESGRCEADGSIAGDDGDSDEKAYEPHYDVITQPGQVQVYQSVMANSDGQVTRALLRAARYVKDNRLLPAGFDKASAGKDFAVYGEGARDTNFVGGSDQVTFRISTGSAQGPFTATAELLYQTLAYPFAKDLGAGSADEGERFAAYYATTDRTPVTVARIEQIVR